MSDPTPSTAARATAVAAGGALGAVLRHAVTVAVPSGTFGLGTVVVNLVGAFALGVVSGRCQTDVARAFWRSGLLGSFTTFSALAVQAVELGSADGVGYVVVHVGLGVAAAAAGLRVGAR